MVTPCVGKLSLHVVFPLPQGKLPQTLQETQIRPVCFYIKEHSFGIDHRKEESRIFGVGMGDKVVCGQEAEAWLKGKGRKTLCPAGPPTPLIEERGIDG